MPYFNKESATGASANPAYSAQERELRSRMQEALCELSDEEHEAVALCVLGGLSHAEASQATGVNINTIKARVRRGTERLRNKFDNRPEGIQAFLALAAFPPPPGGMESALARWISVAGSSTARLPRAATAKLAAVSVAAVILAGLVVFFALNATESKAGETQRPALAALDEPILTDASPEAAAAPGAHDAAPSPGADDTLAASEDSMTEGSLPVEERTPADTGTTPDTSPLRLIEMKYRTGEIRVRGYSLTTPQGERAHGTWTRYHRNGSIIDQGEMRLGVKHGTWRQYHPNGAVLAEGRFEDGRADGLWQYFRDDTTVYARGEWRGELKHGTWTCYFPSGTISQIETWSEGLLDGVRRRFDVDGVLVSETWFADGKRNGRDVLFDRVTGRPITETSYRDDLKDGVELKYDPTTGRVVASALYREGQRQGD